MAASTASASQGIGRLEFRWSFLPNATQTCFGLCCREIARIGYAVLLSTTPCRWSQLPANVALTNSAGRNCHHPAKQQVEPYCGCNVILIFSVFSSHQLYHYTTQTSFLATMTVYVVVQVNVSDPQTYRKYAERTPALVQRHGGRFLTRGAPVVTQEGEPFTERMVILEFPSKEAFDTFYRDPDYAEAVKFRHAASSGRVLVQEGADQGATAPDANV